MSQQDNFLGGFLLGSLMGGLVGGVLGVLVTSRLSKKEGAEEGEPFTKLEGDKRSVSAQSIEAARRGLEDKIAQLNEAIDDVRQKLGTVNGSSGLESSEAIAERRDN